MFDALPASKPLDGPHPWSALIASVLHGAIVTTAILATRAVPSLSAPGRERPLVFTTVIPPAAPRAPIVVDEPAPTLPPPLQAPTAPLVVPRLAPVGLGHASADLRSLVNRGAGETPLTTGGPPAGLDETNAPLTAAEVDEPVTILEQAQPRYPRALADAGVSGQVTLEFVVDSNGVVDPPSLRVVASSDDGFNEAAREAIRDTRFGPARYRRSRVRQLVRQTIRFIAGP